MSPLFALSILAIALVLYVISTYNFFQTSLTRINASIQEIGNQLKRQADLIPNLEASVKGYLKHEKGIIDGLADARKAIAGAVNSTDLSKQSKASSLLTDLIPRLAVIVESNPELKGNTTVQNLMEELRDTADKVMYARRTLIDLTADYNIKTVTVPSNFVAKMFGFKAAEGLKLPRMSDATTVSESDTKSPKINI